MKLEDIDIKDNEQLFVYCPMYDHHVDVESVCSSCKYYGGLRSPVEEKARERLEKKEITVERYESEVDKAKKNVDKLFVICHYPSMRQCNKFSKGSGGGN